MNTENNYFKSVIGVALATFLILLIPFLAMQFSGEILWSLTDFIVAGILIFGTGLAFMLIFRKNANFLYRIAGGLSLGTAFLLIWANLAVGIIGSEANPANQMYFGVIAVGIIGAVIARLRPRGMSNAIFAAAIAQALVVIIVLSSGMHISPPVSAVEILLINGFFVLLWIGAGLLFRKVARK